MTDDYRPVTNLTVHPKRIVSLSPSSTEILFAVGAGPKVVGVTDYCNYPPELEAQIEADEITRISDYWDSSIKTIVKLKPDLVLVSTARCTVKTNERKVNFKRKRDITTQIAAQLRSLGLNVLALNPHSVNDVFDNILSVGRASGNAVAASNLVEKLRQRIENVAKKSRKISHRPKVYFEVWKDPYISVSSGTWIGDVINLAGGANIFGEAVSEWPIISPEDIIQRNPDIIVFPVIPGVPRFWGSFEDVKKRPGWKSVNAVRSGSLYEVPRDFISRPGPRLVEALEILEKFIHTSS